MCTAAVKVDITKKTELLLARGMAMLDDAVNLMYDGEWENSIRTSHQAARVHLVTLVEKQGDRAGEAGLAMLLRKVENRNGKKLPDHLLERSRKLDRVYLLIEKRTAQSLGWIEYHDEEQCSNMIQYARSIIKFCHGAIHRSNSSNTSG